MKPLFLLVAVVVAMCAIEPAVAQTRQLRTLTPQSAASGEPSAAAAPVASEPSLEPPPPVTPAPSPSSTPPAPLVENKGGCQLGVIGAGGVWSWSGLGGLVALCTARRRRS